ncbi:TSUP family transporter [Paludibacterium denitrificans]|uniref:TSUP family transporter n=1 Tax=Paludibacterium denitrificans TaxID=2675226 RepID=UPI001E3ACBA8|nr:TSUP family transporter [Paludibacterium denitrificans]
MSINSRNSQGFIAGSLIGTLGGLIGLGGAEFRLPVLVGVFRLDTLEAVILNKAMSLVVVTAALLFRGGTISPGILMAHLDVVLNLLAGSLVGAWWAAGHAITLPRHWLNRIIMVLLVGLSLVMLSEAWAGVHAERDATVRGWTVALRGKLGGRFRYWHRGRPAGRGRW